MYKETRGLELPGNYNHTLLTELFHHESKRWHRLASHHVSRVFESLQSFIHEAVKHLTVDDMVTAKILKRMETTLTIGKEAADAELRKLCDDQRVQPITYNHYYTDNVQNSRHDATRTLIKKALSEATVEEFNKKMHVSNTTVDAEKLLNAIQKRVLVNMDQQACSEARAGLAAYYKVSRVVRYMK